MHLSSLLLLALTSLQEPAAEPGMPTAATAQTGPMRAGNEDAAPADAQESEEESAGQPRKKPQKKSTRARKPAPEAPVEEGITRMAGDNNIVLTPSGRTIGEGNNYLSVDEMLLWRFGWGVSDSFDVEIHTAWLTSLGFSIKWAMLNTEQHDVALQLGTDAMVYPKRNNAQYASLVYTQSHKRGAWHLGAHAVRVQRARGKSSETYVVPEGTLGAEVRMAKYLTGLIEAGYGQNVLENDPNENTGFVNAGLRIGGDDIFFDLALVVPTSESFLESDFLGIPFVRLGGVW